MLFLAKAIIIQDCCTTGLNNSIGPISLGNMELPGGNNIIKTKLPEHDLSRFKSDCLPAALFTTPLRIDTDDYVKHSNIVPLLRSPQHKKSSRVDSI